MSELFASPFFGIALSILAFWVGVRIQKKTGLVVCNPLLIGIVLVVGVLLLFRIPYESYHQGGEIINMFLAPATACLAVAIYGKIRILKENWLPILVGCVVGSAASMGSILLLCRLFGLDAAMTASLLPKSVTTPIAISVSQAHGGIGPITVVAVLITGIFGSIAALSRQQCQCHCLPAVVIPQNLNRRRHQYKRHRQDPMTYKAEQLWWKQTQWKSRQHP